MKKVLIVVAVVLVAVSAFTLMNKNSDSSSKSTATRVVKDERGKEVVIPTHPKRVLLLSATHLDLFVEAGGADKIVGKPTTQTASKEVQDATANAKEIGQAMALNAEVMMSLNPDLVIGVNMQPHVALIPMFEKAGIPVYIQTINTYEQVLEQLQLYGELSGTVDIAQKKIESIKNKYNTALKKAQGKTPPASLILWGTPESFSMGTKKSFVGDLVERLGGGNILDNTDKENTDSVFVPMSMEYVTKVDPKVIFLITHGSPEGLKAKFQKEMDENPVWKDMSAVKNKRIYTLPYQLFAVNPGSRIGDAINVMADHIYGEN